MICGAVAHNGGEQINRATGRLANHTVDVVNKTRYAYFFIADISI